MFGNYHLYFHNLPTLESRCRSAGIPVEAFLCTGVSHVVVLNKSNLCPQIQTKITSLGVKVVTSKAVHKWLQDYNVLKRQNSPPPAALRPVSSPTPLITQRAELVVADLKKTYKPQYLNKVNVAFYPDHCCTGSPWAKQNAPGTIPRPTPPSRIPTLNSRLPSNRVTASRKIYCENCMVSVTDLDEHLQTMQHKRYARNDKNFAELDEVIGELTLDNLLKGDSLLPDTKRRRVQCAPLRLIRIPFNFNL